MDGMRLSEFRNLPWDVQAMIVHDIPRDATWVRLGGPEGELPGILGEGTEVDEPTEGNWLDDGFILQVRDLEKARTPGSHVDLG